MTTPAISCTVRNCIIDPHEIHYLRFIVEAYEGIGVVSTIDSALGLVSIAIAPGCEADLAAILLSERDNLKLREAVSPGETAPA